MNVICQVSMQIGPKPQNILILTLLMPSPLLLLSPLPPLMVPASTAAYYVVCCSCLLPMKSAAAPGTLSQRPNHALTSNSGALNPMIYCCSCSSCHCCRRRCCMLACRSNSTHPQPDDISGASPRRRDAGTSQKPGHISTSNIGALSLAMAVYIILMLLVPLLSSPLPPLMPLPPWCSSSLPLPQLHQPHISKTGHETEGFVRSVDCLEVSVSCTRDLLGVLREDQAACAPGHAREDRAALFLGPLRGPNPLARRTGRHSPPAPRARDLLRVHSEDLAACAPGSTRKDRADSYLRPLRGPNPLAGRTGRHSPPAPRTRDILRVLREDRAACAPISTREDRAASFLRPLRARPGCRLVYQIMIVFQQEGLVCENIRIWRRRIQISSLDASRAHRLLSCRLLSCLLLSCCRCRVVLCVGAASADGFLGLSSPIGSRLLPCRRRRRLIVVSPVNCRVVWRPSNN
jgi:hypothetical protein